MDISEILEAEQDIEEAFLEVGSKQISVKKLKKSETVSASSIYGETESFEYEEPVPLIGVANINPLSDDLSEVGKSMKCTVVLTIGSKALRENDFYVDGKLNINTDDIFTYLGKEYEIKNITQSGILNDFVLLFGFECIEKDKGKRSYV